MSLQTLYKALTITYKTVLKHGLNVETGSLIGTICTYISLKNAFK